MSSGKNLPHDSAIGHVTGKSIYVDDRPRFKNELLVSYVTAKVAHGNLKGINFAEALKIPGVVGIYTAKDLLHNNWGTVVQDQPLLVQDKIQYFDEPVAIIAAETAIALAQASKSIRVHFEALPAISSIEQAIQAKDFLYVPHPFIRGNAELAIGQAPNRLAGQLVIGGQEHFYMENQAAAAYPNENGAIELHSSTQHPTETQHVVAEALGLDFHKVTCVVKRLGGGFGGKESQAGPIAAMAALVAHKTGRPARMVLTKDEDMKITGKRHPFLNKYEVGFDEAGKILGIRFELYSDGGAYTDLSPSILERAMFHVDSAYYFENVEINAAVCKTNTYSNTAFRGFGGPQGTMVIESIIEDIAVFLKQDAYDIRQLNCYSDGRNTTPYGQVLESNPLPQILRELRVSSEYDLRKAKIQKFNQEQQIKLRGLSMTTTKFGIAFTARFLNQGSALVNLHVDGSAQISTGAVEMGQGVNTKIRQIVSTILGLSPDLISIMPTSTEKNANTSPTAASSGADINGAAAGQAATLIRQRLSIVAEKFFAGEVFDNLAEFEVPAGKEVASIEFRDNQVFDIIRNKSATLAQILKVAHLNRVSVSEYAHFKTEGIGFDKQKLIGKPFKYFTCGAAVTEVEVDRFTGESKVLRTDILMELGRMINPGMDRGQVTGAFVQGMGWVISENLYHNNSGELISHSPTTYKIPNVQDTPRVFNVNFTEFPDQEASILKSKAVGEPPFLLGISCWTAVKNALSFISSAARAQDTQSLPKISSPATNEVILFEIARLQAEAKAKI